MTKIRIYLDCRHEAKDGLYPLVIKMRMKNTTADIATGFRLAKEQWNGEKVINHPQASIYNKVLSGKISNINALVIKVGLMGDEEIKSAADIKRMIVGEEPKQKDKGTIFENYMLDFIEKKKSSKTKETYLYTYNTVKKFNSGNLLLTDINIGFIKEFEAWLYDNGNKTNTISIHLRNIRAVLNSAIDEELLSAEKYPFRRFKIKTAPTIKRSLTVDELRTLRDYPCEEHQVKYRDLFMLSFYLGGINMIDLLNLPNNGSDKIEYIRSKTGIPCCIEIPSVAKGIIERYKGEQHLIFPMDEYKNHKDFLHRLNQNLKEIGKVEIVRMKMNGKTIFRKRYIPLFPNLSSYWARHTWATIAADLDIPDAVIDMALVHRSLYSMSDIYIRRNQNKVNDALRQVIEYVNSR